MGTGLSLSPRASEKFNTTESAAIISGDGSNKPTGLLNTTPVTTDDGASPQRANTTLEYVPMDPGASPSANIQAIALVDLVYTLRTQYWAKASWLMSRATAGKIRKLRDTTGQFLWQPTMAEGAKPTLLGFPVALCDEMPSVALNANAVMFGDFNAGYHLLTRPYKLLADRYTEPGFINLYIRQRVGGQIGDNNAIKVGRIAAA